MSNGDDVLDNWEEIDEAGLTNTLQKIQAERQTQQDISLTKSSSYSTIASAGNISYCNNSNNSTSAGSNNFNADFQPMKLLQRTSSTPDTNSSAAAAALKSPLDDMAATFEPVMMVLHKTNDEYQSANYTAPTNLQTVKILRRPTQSSEPRNNGMRPRQPIKTLQQREQEYAEARLRILGSAKNPEDDVSASNANSTTTTSSSTSVVSLSPTTTTPIASTAIATIAAAATKVNSLPKIPLQQQQQQQSPQQQQHQLPLPQQQQQQQPSGQNVYNNHYHQQQLQQQQQQQNYYYFQQQQQQLLSSPAYNNRALITPMSPQQQQIQQQQQLPIQQQQTWSPVVGGSVSSPTLRQQQQESIVRMPRGPDGSTGFQVRR